MRLSLLVLCAALLAPASADAKTLTQCGTSEGYSCYLPGGSRASRQRPGSRQTAATLALSRSTRTTVRST